MVGRVGGKLHAVNDERLGEGPGEAPLAVARVEGAAVVLALESGVMFSGGGWGRWRGGWGVVRFAIRTCMHACIHTQAHVFISPSVRVEEGEIHTHTHPSTRILCMNEPVGVEEGEIHAGDGVEAQLHHLAPDLGAVVKFVALFNREEG